MVKIKRLEIYNHLVRDKRPHLNKLSSALTYIVEKCQCPDNENRTIKIKAKLKTWFFEGYFKRWQQSCRRDDRFRKLNENWLNTETDISVEAGMIDNPPATTQTDAQRGNKASGTNGKKNSPKRNRGRPKKSFKTSSKRSKRRNVSNLKSSTDVQKLWQATTAQMRSAGETSSVQLLNAINPEVPSASNTANALVKLWNASKKKQQKKYTPEEALSYIVTNNLTKAQYISTLKGAIQRNHDLYPNYNYVLNAKKKVYPSPLSVSEVKCEVSLQTLLHHTCSRILEFVKPTTMDSLHRFELTCKWGFDGSGGYSQMKQAWTEESGDDAYLFVTSLVPLQLQDKTTSEVIWSNPLPSSPRFCRPIRLQWTRETDEMSRLEQKYIEDQVHELQPYVAGACQVFYSMHLTMLDGKVCNALTGSSSMSCYICKAKISQMNNLDAMIQRVADSSTLKFGLSVLHARIKFFECILHISYRQDFESWKAKKSDGSQQVMLDRKKKIQDSFLKEMNIRVDFPKQGFGSTNDGNTARRFFQNVAKSAEITGIDEGLIHRFAVILQVMASGLKIDVHEFKQYCFDTAKLYVDLYPWYYMPPTVHKVLIHGWSVIEQAPLPIGQLSEEPLEASHKVCKKFRLDFSRMCSRKNTNADIFHRLLLRSDPLISLTPNISADPVSKAAKLSPEAVQLLDVSISERIRLEEFFDECEVENETEDEENEMEID